MSGWSMDAPKYRCPQNPNWASNPLELKFQAAVSHLMWVLGINLGSSAGHTHNSWPSLQDLDCLGFTVLRHHPSF